MKGLVEDLKIANDNLYSANKMLEKEIERLNKKIEQYENPEDMTLMFMWCDEKAKDEIKRLNNIINKAMIILEDYQNSLFTEEQRKTILFDTTPETILRILKGEDK